METVIVLAVAGILILECWDMGKDVQRHWAELDSDPNSVEIGNYEADWSIWGLALVGALVTAWIAPALLLFVGFVYLVAWLQDRLWFWHVDRIVAARPHRTEGVSCHWRQSSPTASGA